MLQRAYSLLPSSLRSTISPKLKSAMRNMNVARVSPGVLMDLDPDEWYQNQIRRGSLMEEGTISRIAGILKPGDAYVDVGAHVGFQTLAARLAIGESGLVIAVEPQPYNCARILRNWTLNGFSNVVVYSAAASDSESFLTLNDQPAEDRARLSIEAESLAGDMPQRFNVPARRLDHILAEQNVEKIALLKVDAESHELPVIRGLGERLRDVENLIIEVYDPTLPRYVELAAMLRSAGFVLKNIRGEIWKDPEPLEDLNLWAARN